MILNLNDYTFMTRKIARRITANYLHNAALFYLQRYAASTGRLRQVLINKIRRSCRDHPDQEAALLLPLVETEIATLQRVELLADDRLAAQLLDGYRARGISSRLIAQKLSIKGFTPDLIKNLLGATHHDETTQTEIEAARRYLQRRRLWPYGKAPSVGPKDKQKSYAALARQGYDPDVINTAMKGNDES